MYAQLQEEIRRLSADIRRMERVESGERIDAAIDLTKSVGTKRDRIMQSAAYRHHLVTYLKEAKTAFENGERETLCTCGDPYCPLKRGTLPAAVTRAEDLDTGIEAYKLDHADEPRVLLEARESWLEDAREVRETLQQALATLRKRDVDEPADADADETGEAA